jgi:hypothetical protein
MPSRQLRFANAILLKISWIAEWPVSDWQFHDRF